MKKANKKLASAIVLGLMLAVPVGASAAGEEGTYIVNNENKGAENVSIAVQGNNDTASTVNGTYGIVSKDGFKGEFTGENINIKVNNTGNGFAIGAGAIVVRANEEASVTNSKLILGDKNTENVKIDVRNDGWAVGLLAYRATGATVNNPHSDGSIEVNGDNLVINVHATDPDDYYGGSTGIHVQNGTDSTSPNNQSDRPVEVIINSKNTVINATADWDGGATGMTVISQGKLTINGDLEVNADTVLSTRGEAVTKINESGKNTVKLNGDISFDYNDKTSKTTINADVIINLTNADSYLNGNIATTSDIKPIPDGKDNVDGMQLGLANGAQWTTDADSFVNTLNFNDGIININGGENHKVQLDKVEGTGGTVNIKAEIEDGGSVTSGKLNIGEKAEEDITVNTLLAKNTVPKLDVNFTGVTADDITVEQFQDLSKNINITSGQNVTASSYVADGLLTGGYSASIAANGEGVSGDVNVKETSETMDNMRDIASVALIAWRQEDSTLSQRLGELRSSEGDQGIWARMSRGEFEYGGAFKNQYNYFQLGYDWAAKDWHYGAAISHNDGQTTYANGYGENDSTSLTLYGTWLGDKGQYTDIVVKQGKLNNEFTNYAEAGTTTGDYDMWGTSISAEYGQKLEMENDWYVTPQAQLTYMRIGGEDYTAIVTKDGNSAPMQVSQDGMDSFVGRIGFEAGKNISEKGSIYAKASLLHEFAGEADTTLLYDGKNAAYSQDLGDTWYECGFGVNYKTSDNSYVYADVVKTFGGDVETPWQWNAGMRFTF